jgi:hypothetical protein
VLVFDRHAPRFAPPVDSLSFGSHPPIEGLRFAPARAAGGRAGVTLDWKRDHPLLRFVALDGLVTTGAARVTLPDRAETLATGGEGPIMAVIPGDGARHVVVAFELFKSNWPMQVGFPVFVANALPWLALGGDGGGATSFQPGDVAVAPVVGAAAEVTYQGPVKIGAPVRDGRATMPAFRRVGVYRATGPPGASPGLGAGGVEKPWDVLAVNLLNEAESDPRPAAELRISKGAAPAAPIESAQVRQEAWRWFLWAALAFLLVEWIVYTRRLGT